MLLEAQQDVDQIVKWNLGKLYDADPEAFKSMDDRTKNDIARWPRGPYKDSLYSSKIMMYLKNIPLDRMRYGRKKYIRWFVSTLDHVQHDTENSNLYLDNDVISLVVDWIEASEISADELITVSFPEAYRRAMQWHNEEFEPDDNIIIDESNVVYRWPDDWVIVRVQANECAAEGQAMGHCLGTYASRVKAGLTTIYSLRDPSGHPHVTIEILFEKVVHQIRGKQNKAPIEAYANRVKEWLGTTDFIT